jgi:hypothetical protein
MHHSDGGLALSYNAQISADAAHGLIVGVALTPEPNDSAQLWPAVERIEKRWKSKPQQLVADGGYTTREVIEKMAGGGIDFLGSMGREERPSGITTPKRIPPSAFLFEPEENRYICPEGQRLRPQGRFAYKKKRGLVAYGYQAKSSDCAPCIRKPECCPENQSQGRGLIRRVENSAIWEFRKKMASPEAQAPYRRRGRVVEFCHAWINSKLGLRQFPVPGLRKAGTELLWACLPCNLPQGIRIAKLPANPAAT